MENTHTRNEQRQSLPRLQRRQGLTPEQGPHGALDMGSPRSQQTHKSIHEKSGLLPRGVCLMCQDPTKRVAGTAKYSSVVGR